MNKIIIFVVACLFIMSFIVESVSAAEATEVLKARLTVMKNTLKASDSKAETAKVDVGVAAGVGAGVDGTKNAKPSLLESQTKLAAKNSNLRRNSPQVNSPTPKVNAPAPVIATAATVTPIVVPAPAPQAAPATSQKQESDLSAQQHQIQKQLQNAEVQISSTQPESQADAVQNAKVAAAQQEKKAQFAQNETVEAAVNITAVIDEYIADLEAKINEQMESIHKAYAEYRAATKEKMITLAAKLLTKIQALEEAMQKAAEERAAYEKRMNDKTEQNKDVVKKFLEEAKKKAEEEKKRIQDEVDQIIEAVRPKLEEAEAAFREKKENATRAFNNAMAAITNAMKAVGEYRYHKMKAQLLLRYPLTAAKLYLYYEKLNNEDQANSTQTLYRAALVEKSAVQQKQQRSVGPAVVEKANIKTTSYLQKQRSGAAVVSNEKQAEPQPAILVSLNTNKLKQKLKN